MYPPSQCVVSTISIADASCVPVPFTVVTVIVVVVVVDVSTCAPLFPRALCELL